MASRSFIFQYSILAIALLSGFSININPAHAEVACIITDDDKPMCGKMISIPRMCIASNDGQPICGKFTKVKKEDRNSGRRTSEPFKNPGDGNPAYTKKIDGLSFSLTRCSKSDVSGPIIICLFYVQNSGNIQKEKTFTLRTRASNFVDFDGKSYPGLRSTLDRIESKSFGDDVSISMKNRLYFDGSMIFRVTEEMDLNRVPLLNVATNLGTFQFWNLSELK